MVSGGSPRTLERKIYFFRADVGTDAGGQPVPFDPVPAIHAIEALPYTNDSNGRYEFDDDGNALSLRRHSNSPNVAVVFGRVRRNGLPQVEQAGTISDLLLDPDSGLLEAIHVVFFPTNIVGAEYNHFAPRLSRLGTYLHEKSSQAIIRPVFRALLRRDAAEQLDRLTEISMLDISIHPSFSAKLKQAERSLGDAFEANASVLDNPETVQLVIKPQRMARQSARDRLVTSFKELFNQNDELQGVERFQIRGKCEDTGRIETIDLLKDQLISIKQIVRMNQRSRALEPSSAFQAIREAYDQLRPELESAAGVSP